MPFEMFRNDKVIKYDQKAKEWYVSLGKLNLPKKYLKIILGVIDNLHFEKESDDTIDVRYLLTDFPSQKRAKDDQSIEIFMRRAIYIQLTKNELKAIEFFSELNENYIGKDAANTFYSYLRSLAQMIVSPVE